jgi:hypothetical protein
MRLPYPLFFTCLLSAEAFSVPAAAQEIPGTPSTPAPELRPPTDLPQTVLTGVEDNRVRPWGGIAYQTGPGIGYRDAYTTFEGFIPVYQNTAGLVFGDLRGLLTNDSLVNANLGGGYRYYSCAGDRIWGANFFWDLRDAGQHTFNQAGFGFESLGRRWDARANVYLVAGPDEKELSAVYSNPVFVQHFIQLDRSSVAQAAMSGFDAEVGMPVSCCHGLKAFVGTYNYQVSESPQAWGVKGRLEERLTDNLDLNLTYANDKVFGNSVIFSAGYRFGGRSSRTGAARCGTYARRADRIERNEEIVVTNTAQNTHVLALDPATGKPIIVEHADSNAAPGGDGSVEHPFQTLAQLQAGSAPGQILFAHAGSVFTPTVPTTLQTGQRFLGEGVPHLFTALQGTFLLPGATSGAVPFIFASSEFFFGPPAIVLASNSEVSGFRITAPLGISGTGVSNFSINNNTFAGYIQEAVLLTNPGGGGHIIGNSFLNGSTGVLITSSNGSVGAIGISGNTFNFLGGGIAVVTNDNLTTFTVGISNNTFNDTAANVVAHSGSTVCVRLQGNVSGTNYLLENLGGTFKAETSLFGTNTGGGVVTSFGTITSVPAGSCPVP